MYTCLGTSDSVRVCKHGLVGAVRLPGRRSVCTGDNDKAAAVTRPHKLAAGHPEVTVASRKWPGDG